MFDDFPEPERSYLIEQERLKQEEKFREQDYDMGFAEKSANTTPTKKSAAVEQILTELAGISRQDAAEQKICTWCKKPIAGFKDALSEKEYRVSGFCQECQDATFDSAEDETESDMRGHPLL